MNAPTVGEHCSTSTPYDRDYNENVSHNMRMTNTIMMKMFHIMRMRMTNMIMTVLNIIRGNGGGGA